MSQERLTPHSAAWPIVQTTLQLDYRAIRAAALAPGSPDAVFHRRWLGYQVRKLGVAHTSLIPLDLPPEAPIEPTTTLTDNFDRANADPPSNSAEGWAWAEVAGDRWAIVSNKLTLATGSSAAHQLRAQSDLAGADQTVGADITWPLATTRIAGLAGRYASAADTCYWGYARADSNNCRIGKRIAAVDTVLSTSAVKPTAGSPVACALTVDGSALRWVIAGVCDMNLTDTAISSGARAGCKLLAFTADNGLIDNWQAADIAPGGGACNSLPLLGTGC